MLLIWSLLLVGPVLCLNNNGKPIIQDLFASSKIVENESLFLSCQVGGGGRVHFKWFFESQELKTKKEIDPNDDNISVTNLDAVSILNIRSMTTDASGYYTCEVTNSFGSDSKTVNLKLNSKLFRSTLLDSTNELNRSFLVLY